MCAESAGKESEQVELNPYKDKRQFTALLYELYTCMALFICFAAVLVGFLTSQAWAAAEHRQSDMTVRNWALEKRGVGLTGPEEPQQILKIKVWLLAGNSAAPSPHPPKSDLHTAQVVIAGRVMGLRLDFRREPSFC